MSEKNAQAEAPSDGWHTPGLGEVHSPDHKQMIYCEAEDVNGEMVASDDLARRVRAALATQQAEALAQQERVPLTKEQIHEMALQEQFLLICDDLDAVTEIVRATELAHHIRAARSSEGGQP